MAAVLIPLIIFTPWLSAIMLWFIGDQHEQAEHTIASGATVLSAIFSLLLLLEISDETLLISPIGPMFGDVSFTTNAMSVLLVCIANCIGSLTVIYSAAYMRHEKSLGRYYGMILLFIGAMSGLVLTSNIFLLFFFWEITALCSYQLISFYNDDPNAVRGGLKALFITQFGGIGLMTAALLIYGQIQSLSIPEFIEAARQGAIPTNVLSLIGFLLIAAAAAKSSQFPFFTWLPDAMEAPTPVSALIHAATMVNSGIYLLARFYPAFENVPGWKETILVIGILTIILSSLMAIFANDLKRVLAYSTVSQLGYMFTAIGAGSVLASQFHLLSHAIFKALLFLAAGALIHSISTRDMHQMGGLFKKVPIISVTFIIGALALAGIPILNGFWSKELILEAVHEGTTIWIYLIMLFSVILTAIYTIRCVWLVFFGTPRSDRKVHDAPRLMAFPLVLLAIGTLTSWLFFTQINHAFSTSLPLHKIELETLTKMADKVLSDPLTYIAIGMSLAGVGLWFFKKKKDLSFPLLDIVREASLNSFRFESANTGIIQILTATSEGIRNLQTGSLNWNIFGMIAGFLIVSILLLIGGR